MDELPDEKGFSIADGRYSWIDRLDDDALSEAILALPKDHIEILTLLRDGYSQTEIAAMRGVQRAALCRLVGRIAEKLKRFHPM